MCIFCSNFARFLQSKRKMIKHDGIIIALNEDGTALVRVVQTSACAACKAKAMCASAESAEKEMTVVLLGESAPQKSADFSGTPQAMRREGERRAYKVGDTVEVMVQQKMGWKAVVLAYLLPFFVMLAVMLIGNAIWAVREEILGTVALCAMALYYLVLGMFKDKLQKEFSFTARKKNA
jgi:sigma-E factor negative regulatory protein RseC